MKKAELLLVEAHLTRAAEAWADGDYDRVHEWLGAAYAIAGEHSANGGVR